MKKFWTILLSLGLVAAFCLPASALEMKMAGSYLITGQYESNREVRDNGPSMAYYAQRIRLEPEFKIAEGLDFHTRIDAMTRVWGQTPVGNEHVESSWLNGDTSRYGENEQNIQFRRGWVSFQVPFGMFLAGYMADGILPNGNFGSFASEGPNILFLTKIGPVVPVIGFEHVAEGRLGNDVVGPGNTDSDFIKPYAGATYYGGWGEIGLLYVYYRTGEYRDLPWAYGPFKMEFHWIESHGKFNMGGFFAEYEFVYEWGKYADYEDGVHRDDVDDEGLEWYINAKYSFGPAYVGGLWGYSQGDDPRSDDHESGIVTNGWGVWQPCLILWNDWLDRFGGNIGHHTNGTSARELDSAFNNANLLQVYAGYNPVPKLALKGSFSYAWADEQDAGTKDHVLKGYDDEMGYELDLTASYKIYDNLEYMVGFAYLWTGDYFKGFKDVGEDGDHHGQNIDDDYLIINQLSLTF